MDIVEICIGGSGNGNWSLCPDVGRVCPQTRETGAGTGVIGGLLNPIRSGTREQETESRQTGLRRAKRKLNPKATGRLKPLRLFSTLLAIALTDRIVSAIVDF